jgi:hypothetical protein
VPTKHRRHAITETPPVKAALDELRREQGSDRVDLAELVILGAREKAARLSCGNAGDDALHQLADEIRTKRVPVGDPAAAEQVRRTGWARPLRP